MVFFSQVQLSRCSLLAQIYFVRRIVDVLKDITSCGDNALFIQSLSLISIAINKPEIIYCD